MLSRFMRLVLAVILCVSTLGLPSAIPAFAAPIALYDNLSENLDLPLFLSPLAGAQWEAQSFTTDATKRAVTAVTLPLSKDTPGTAGTFSVEIWSESGGLPSAKVATISATVAAASLASWTGTTSSPQVVFSGLQIVLSPSTIYFIVIDPTNLTMDSAIDWDDTLSTTGTGVATSIGASYTPLYGDWTIRDPAPLGVAQMKVEADVPLPTLTTDPAGSITTTGAMLAGTVNDNGADTVVTFEYGLTTGYGSVAAAAESPVTADTGNTAMSAAITSLAPNTQYHFRVVGVNASGTTYGSDRTFTTLAAAPTAVTQAAANVVATTATLSGTVNALNANTTITFEYGVTTGYGTIVTATQSPLSTGVDTILTAPLTGLTPNTTYHYRVVAASAGGTTTGLDQSFATNPLPPTAITPSVSAGSIHTCAIKSDGTLACWGDNTYGQSTVPSGIGTVTQVSASNYDNCVLKSDGTLACWGRNPNGQSTVPNGLGTVTQVSQGATHTCAIKSDGTLACWGSNAYGQTTVPSDLGPVTQVGTGLVHTCAIKSDGTLVCWGRNNYGQSTVPSDLGTVTRVGTGWNHTCALKSDGTVACWGSNSNGQATPPLGTFTQVSAGDSDTCAIKSDGALACWGESPPAGTFTQVSAGLYHTCAIRSDGTLTCWGDNRFGQAPAISLTPTTLPAGARNSAYAQTLSAAGGTAPYTYTVAAGALPAGLSLSTAGALSGAPTAGGLYTFTVQAADSYTTGLAFSGQQMYTVIIPYLITPTTGIGGSITPNTAQVVSTGGNRAFTITANPGYHVVDVRVDGVSQGALASYTFTNVTADHTLTTTFALDPLAPSAATHAASGVTTTSVTLSGTVNALNASTTITFEYGVTTGYGTIVTATQSPLSTGVDTIVTAPLTGLTPNTTYHYRVVAASAGGTTTGLDQSFATNPLPPTVITPMVSAGGYHICAIKSDGTLACWGDNSQGQATPPAGTFTQVSAGGLHTCAIKSDGTLACWGNNSQGQATPPAGTFTQVDTGFSLACALKSDGTLACWGYNAYGQATPPAGTFTQVTAGSGHSCALKSDATLACWGSDGDRQLTDMPAGTFTQVSAGGFHTCAIKSDGTLACWGDNRFGQLTGIPAGTFTQVSAGGYHTCAIKSDGTLACWGNNSQGQQLGKTPAGTFTQVGAGWTYTCARRSDDTLACWGYTDAAGLAPAISLSPTTLPAGNTVSAYAQTLSAAGGTAPYTYTVAAGALPAGLSLSAAGVISGTPATTGSYTFTVQATGSFTTGLAFLGQRVYVVTINIIGVPSVTTLAVSGVRPTGATLHGTINANNDSTTVTFQYGLTAGYGLTATADQSPVTGAADTSVSVSLSGLTPATLYHFRVAGTNVSGTTYGSDQTFTTGVSRTCHVKQSASGADSGASWTDAYTNLQSALGDPTCTEVWVAAGTYMPGGLRTDTFTLNGGVAVYGGFAGTESLLSERDPVANVTLLSGDIDHNDSQTPIITDTLTVTGNDANSYHVVTGATGATLDGFTITAGNANDDDDDSSNPENGGGGMYNADSRPTLTNVIFTGNTALFFGGGIFNGGSSLLTLTNVALSGNKTSSSLGGYGGGLANMDGASLALNDVIFSDNRTMNYGGGLVNMMGGSAVLTNVAFISNTVDMWGGGLLNMGTLTMTNSTFSGNAGDLGGGMFNYGSNPVLTNITFSSNAGNSGGGGMENEGGSNPQLFNTIFWGNTATLSGTAQISNEAGSVPTVSDSVIQDGCPAGSSCSNIITADPLLGPLGNYGGLSPVLPVQPGSSAIDATSNNCPATDQRGQPRSTPPCDIGAYEYSLARITAFKVPGQAGGTAINDFAGTIVLTMPFGTNVTALTPTITHTGASVRPANGVAADFTSPVVYTVTAADSSTKTYTATVTLQASAVTVDPTATPATPGWGVSVFASLQAAIDTAATGAKLTVTPGTYAESVTLNRNLTVTFQSGVTVNGAFTQTAGIVNGPAGDLTITGNLTLNGGAFDAPSGNLNLGGNFSLGGGMFNPNGGTVTFTGPGGQTIGGTTPTTFTNLIVAGASPLTSTAPLTVTSGLTITTGTFGPASGSTFNDVVIGSGGNLVATGRVVITGSLNNAGTFNPGSGPVIVDGGLTNSGTFLGGSAPISVTGALTNTGELTLGQGILTGGLTNSGTLTATAPFTLTGDLTSSGDFNGGPGPLTFAGPGAQLITGTVPVSLAQIIITGGAILSPTHPITVTGPVTITNGTLDLPAGSDLGRVVLLPGGTFNVPPGGATTGPVDNQGGTLNGQTLTLGTAGNGSGQIGVAPSGNIFATGTVVTLTATPDSGSAFTSWSGDCSGGGSCVVTMTANHAVTAAFTTNAASHYLLYLPLVVHDPQPDLIVSFSLSPTAPAASQPVTISVVVTNTGSAPAGNFWVDFYINPASPPTQANQIWNSRCGQTPCIGIAWYVTQTLALGQSVRLTSTPGSYAAAQTRWPGSFARGTTDLYVYVDSYSDDGSPNGAGLESNESNNRAEQHGLNVAGVGGAETGLQPDAGLPPLTRPR